jgi:hypothetical protein
MFLQTVYLYWKHDPKKLAEKIAAEQEAAKEKRRQERIEARQKYGDDKAAGTTGAAGEKTMSKKESNRRKLAEARKRDAKSTARSMLRSRTRTSNKKEGHSLEKKSLPPAIPTRKPSKRLASSWSGAFRR